MYFIHNVSPWRWPEYKPKQLQIRTLWIKYIIYIDVHLLGIYIHWIWLMHGRWTLVKTISWYLFWEACETQTWSLGRIYNIWKLNMVVHKVTIWLQWLSKSTNVRPSTNYRIQHGQKWTARLNMSDCGMLYDHTATALVCCPFRFTFAIFRSLMFRTKSDKFSSPPPLFVSPYRQISKI
jgi:hypothetical protein